MYAENEDVQRQNIILVIITCGLLLFLGLGAKELSDTEAIVALRAKATAEKQAWTDQSSYTPGGVTNATQAPLLVWAESAFVRTAGWNKPFMLRLWSVLSGVAALVLVYYITAFFVGESSAMPAPVLLAGSLMWNHFARSAQPDVPAVVFFMLSVLAVLRAVHAYDMRERYTWSAVYAVAVCCALLLDVVIGAAATSLLLYTRRRESAQVVVGGLVGIAIALCWYVHMIFVQGSLALRAMLASSVVMDTAHAFSLQAIATSVTDLLISQPLAVVALLAVIMYVRPKRADEDLQPYKESDKLLHVWAMGALALFALPISDSTRVVFALPPLVILTVSNRYNVFRMYVQSRVLSAAFLFMVFLVVFRLLGLVQVSELNAANGAGFRLASSSSAYPPVMLPIIALFLSAGILRLISPGAVVSINNAMMRSTRMVLPVILVLHCAWLNTTSTRRERDGAKEVGAWLEQSQQRMFTVVLPPEKFADVYGITSSNNSDGVVPQLSWYTQGWAGWTQSQPWRPAYGCNVLRLTTDASANAAALAQAERRDEPIVFVRGENEYTSIDLRRAIARKETKRYVVYSRVAYSTAEDEE